MKKSYSIDQLAAASARLAQSDAAQLQRQMASLRDAVGRLAIHAPVIRTPRTKTKTTTSYGALFGVSTGDLATIGGALLGSRSAAQNAGALLAQLALGQRIR